VLVYVIFVPAPFQLFEFDDSAVPGKGSVRRWLGISDQAAEEVCLGWAGGGGRQAVVSTALPSRHSSDYDRRFNTVFLFLGGTQLTMDNVPTDATSAQEMIRDLAGDAERWTRGGILTDAQPLTADITRTGNVIAGYLATGAELACFAAVGVDLSAIRLRTLTTSNARAYPANPTTRLSVDELNSQLR
jgi:hypothetical protein